MNITPYYRFPVIYEKDNSLPFLLMSVGKSCERNVCRPCGIAHHQLLFSVSGVGETIINGKKIKVPENSLMYHEPNTMHKYYPVSDKWVTAWITFEQKWSLLSARSGVYQLADASEYISFCDRLIDIEEDISFEENATVVLYEFLIKIQNELNIGDNTDKLAPAIDYISKNFYRDISLEELSLKCSMTREYFCRLFKKSYHTTAFSYLKNIRLQEAKKLLKLHKDRSIAKIAGDVGYNSLNYFVTDFKKNEGITPTEFKQNP